MPGKGYGTGRRGAEVQSHVEVEGRHSCIECWLLDLVLEEEPF